MNSVPVSEGSKVDLESPASNLADSRCRVTRGGKHVPKIIANRPGLATLKCVNCGRKSLAHYSDRKEYEQLREATKKLRNGARGIFPQ